MHQFDLMELLTFERDDLGHFVKIFGGRGITSRNERQKNTISKQPRQAKLYSFVPIKAGVCKIHYNKHKKNQKIHTNLI